MNYGKLTAGTTKTAIDTAKPSEKGEIITYLSRMGDVLHNIFERGEIIVPSGTIHAVIDGDKTHATLTQNFHSLTDFQILTPQTAHVLDTEVFHIPGFNFFHHSQKSGTVKTSATDTIVRKVDRVRKVMLGGVVLQQLLLRRDLSRYVFVKKCAIRIDKKQKERYNNTVIDNNIIV